MLGFIDVFGDVEVNERDCIDTFQLRLTVYNRLLTDYNLYATYAIFYADFLNSKLSLSLEHLLDFAIILIIKRMR